MGLHNSHPAVTDKPPLQVLQESQQWFGAKTAPIRTAMFVIHTFLKVLIYDTVKCTVTNC